MASSELRRKIALALMAAGLCAALAGCASDTGAQSAGQRSSQLRYYGGPKYPMWPSQQ
jgi:hypothetical protein